MGGDAYMEKVSTMALCSLTTRMSRKQRKSFKNKATVDAHWVCMMTAHVVPIRIGTHVVIYTYTCGLLRCSSLKDGQCETP